MNKYSTRKIRYYIQNNRQGKYRLRRSLYMFGIIKWWSLYFIYNPNPKAKMTYWLGNCIKYPFDSQKDAQDALVLYLKQRADIQNVDNGLTNPVEKKLI